MRPSALSINEARYWKLVSECERLSKEESVAIRERNLVYLESLLVRKESIVLAMKACEVIIDSQKSDFLDRAQRLSAIKQAHADNYQSLNQLSGDLQGEHSEKLSLSIQKKATLSRYYSMLDEAKISRAYVA